LSAYHETTVFSPIATTLVSFTGWGDGEREPVEALKAGQLIFGYGDLIEAAAAAGHEVIQGAYFEAEPSAPPDAATFDILCERVVASCERTARGGRLDAVLLFQHGAQIAAGVDDCESVLLARLRQTLGSHRIPIGTLLDLHGNTTPEMLRRGVEALCAEQVSQQ
jgi:microcystin degradation protein MlrC